MPKRESDLSRKLAHVIKPRAGLAAQLETLAEAARLILEI